MRAPTRQAPPRSPITDLRWTLRATRGQRARLPLAAVLGAAALGCGVALTATSAWLISAAALQPPVLTLMVAIVAVRAFGLGRGVLRYAERLVSHDAALRCASALRVQIWTQLVRLGPAATARIRRGELLSRLVADVVAGLPDAAVRLLTALPAAGRLAELAVAQAPVTEPASSPHVTSPTRFTAEGLAVRWPGADPDAVRDVDLGSRLALVNPSGSGKSTVVATLMRTPNPRA
jgi:ABC-type transport system involved in cytochrome bd biosynthesis fused ATPase/permease subunit